MQNQLVVCLGLVLSLVYAQTGHQFQASFSSYNDPLVLGTMLGTVNYDNTKHLLLYNYQVNGGIVSEYFDFVKKLRYLKCTTCDAETYTNPEPIFYTDGATVQGAAITIGGQTCTPYTITDTNNPIATVYATAAGLPCRAVYRATPKTIDFSNWQAVDPNALTAIAGWGCPAQQCNKMIDFMLIFDESGSIVPSDFTREVQFGSSIASNYVFGPQNIGMGLVQFASTARTTIPLQFNQQSFLNAMNLVYQIGGGTNMGSGFTNAMAEVNVHGRQNVAKIFTILTDGQNNINVNQFPNIINSVRAAGITVFSIGVGAAVDANQITSMATVIPGVPTSFPQVPSFSALAGIVNNLVINTCINIPGNPCGPGCQGFCSCKGTCACPSSCDDNNKCTDDACDPNRGYSCQHTTHACSDGNFCTEDKCDPVNGCYFPTLVCNSPDACHNASCDPAIGCQYPPVNCDNGNPCFAPSCNPQAGCQYTPVNCDKCKFPTPVVCPAIPCFVNQCNVTNGVCQATPLNCDDGNACTDDSCDTGTGKCVHQLKSCSNGNLCNHNLCDVKTGCYWVPFNVSVDCDDGSNCTIDTCDVKKGCVHTPIVCDDGNNCTSNNCSYLSGCFFPPLNCLANPRIAKLLGTCYQALCSNAKGGCFLDQLPGTTVDSCGVCNGKNECVIVPLPSNVPYVIGGALLAVIIIGSIIVFAALAAFGGKKGYDIWLAHRNNMSGASTNPLYDAKGLSGTNPMYNAK